MRRVMMDKDFGAVSGSREPDPQAVPALSGFDPGRLSADDKHRLRNAGSNFGAPEFSRLACEWMGVQGFATRRRERGRWALTPFGREVQGLVLSRTTGER